jgi:alkanesulfonate monooxygenase SsuD/methylene tetrahydromethanopterin reductase-like flavin-dependent oxidoreductase (luciferase family)
VTLTLVDELLIHGAPEACRERIAEFARVSGVTPLVIPMGEHASFQDITRLGSM